jgi:SCY1-like protein 2
MWDYGRSHKSTGKEVSVWIFEKKVLDGIKPGNGRTAAEGREWVLERLKKEVT